MQDGEKDELLEFTEAFTRHGRYTNYANNMTKVPGTRFAEGP
jgi:hypothetical protein